MALPRRQVRRLLCQDARRTLCCEAADTLREAVLPGFCPCLLQVCPAETSSVQKHTKHLRFESMTSNSCLIPPVTIAQLLHSFALARHNGLCRYLHCCSAAHHALQQTGLLPALLLAQFTAAFQNLNVSLCVAALLRTMLFSRLACCLLCCLHSLLLPFLISVQALCIWHCCTEELAVKP